MSQLYLAIDIGGTNTKFALIKKNGSVVEKFRIPTRTSSFNHLVEDIKNSVGVNLNDIISIGICAPDVAPNKLEIKGANNLAFKNAKVVEVFSRAFNNVEVRLENDANTAAIGEYRLGVAKEVDNFIVLTIGTGLGSGVFIDGKLFQGGAGSGAEVGHMSFTQDGRKCGCGQRGHVETYVSCPGACLTHKEIHNIETGFTVLAEQFLASEKKAVKTIEVFAKQVAQVCANLNVLLSPELIIIAGGGAVLGVNFLTLVQNAYSSEYEYQNFESSTKIRLSEFTPEYGAIMGAFALTQN